MQRQSKSCFSKQTLNTEAVWCCGMGFGDGRLVVPAGRCQALGDRDGLR